MYVAGILYCFEGDRCSPFTEHRSSLPPQQLLSSEYWPLSGEQIVLLLLPWLLHCKQQMEISQIHVEQVCQDKRPELCPVICLGSLPFQEARKELQSNRWVEVMPCLTTDLKLTRFLPGGPSFAIYFNNTSYKKSFQRGKVLVTRRGCR